MVQVTQSDDTSVMCTVFSFYALLVVQQEVRVSLALLDMSLINSV